MASFSNAAFDAGSFSSLAWSLDGAEGIPLGEILGGRSHDPVIINVMARPAQYDQVALAANYLLTPQAEAEVSFDYSTFAIPETSPQFEPAVADAEAYVGKILQPKLGTNEVIPRAEAVGYLAGYAVGVEYSWVKPQASATVSIQPTPPVITEEDISLLPITVKNPTEEELVAIIMSRKRKKPANMLTSYGTNTINNTSLRNVYAGQTRSERNRKVG